MSRVAPSLLPTSIAIAGWLAFAPAVPGQIISTLSVDYQTQLSNQRCFVFAPSNQTTWNLVLDQTAQRLLLRTSTNGGATWSGTVPIPMIADHGHGAIAMGADCKTLHIVFTARDPAPAWSVFYWSLDTTSSIFSPAVPVPIAIGTPAVTDYFANDIDVTAKGRVVIAFSERTSTPVWRSFLRIAPQPPACTPATFAVTTYPMDVGPGNWALHPSLQALGETVHTVFRSSIGVASDVKYRGFDTNGIPSWTSLPVQIAADASSIAHIASDDDCTQCGESRLYILYSIGAAVSGFGEIRMRSALLPTLAWSAPTVVAPDPALLRGDHAYCHYTLTTGPQRFVLALFSVANQANLLSSAYLDGAFVGLSFLLPTAIPGRFECLNGLRTGGIMSFPQVVYSGNNGIGDKDVWLLADTDVSRAVSFGRYTGFRNQVPRLAAINAPTWTTNFSFAICEVPPSLPGILFLGFTCAGEDTLLPGFFFDSGSYAMQDWPIAISYVTVPCASDVLKGSAQFTLPLTGNILGLTFYLQAIQAFGSPFPLVPTNSMAVTIGS